MKLHLSIVILTIYLCCIPAHAMEKKIDLANFSSERSAFSQYEGSLKRFKPIDHPSDCNPFKEHQTVSSEYTLAYIHDLATKSPELFERARSTYRNPYKIYDKICNKWKRITLYCNSYVCTNPQSPSNMRKMADPERERVLRRLAREEKVLKKIVKNKREKHMKLLEKTQDFKENENLPLTDTNFAKQKTKIRIVFNSR